LRATNTGATAVVSHKGEILFQAAPNMMTVLQAQAQGREGETPYMKLGGSLPLMGLLLVWLTVVWVWFKHF